MNEFLVKLIANGGPGSGNFNPGQGRGKGKPGSGSSSKSSTKISDQDKADAERIRKEVTEQFLAEEPTERTRERVRRKIIEMEPNYDYDEYDKLSDHAFDLVDGCDSYGDLRNMLRREYSGFLSDSEIDDLIGLTAELEAYNPF